MLIDDAVLPAARYLTGPESTDVLRTTVRAAGGELLSARASQVQYRPGSELVVRYEATVGWAGADPVAETLLAATTSSGPMDGTVPLTATTERGELSVGVWRWPFDPVLVGLGDAVTPTGLAPLLDTDPAALRLEVVAYRPTERAVVRAGRSDGSASYVKVVRPSTASALVQRHERLLAAGVPVPPITAHDTERGIVVMDELRGDTLRERLKAGTGPWPGADRFRHLRRSLAAADLGEQPPVRRRVADAIGHGAMLAEILPDQRDLVADLTEHLYRALDRSLARGEAIIHGDLYEAQIVLGDHDPTRHDPTRHDPDGHDPDGHDLGDHDPAGRISGLLDVDDVGPGDPLDDLATVLGHLRYRASTAVTAPAAIARYADRLREEFGRDVDPTELDVVTGAVIVGLATGPFRIQQADWPAAVRHHLATAAELIRSPAPDRVPEPR